MIPIAPHHNHRRRGGGAVAAAEQHEQQQYYHPSSATATMSNAPQQQQQQPTRYTATTAQYDDDDPPQQHHHYVSQQQYNAAQQQQQYYALQQQHQYYASFQQQQQQQPNYAVPSVAATMRHNATSLQQQPQPHTTTATPLPTTTATRRRPEDPPGNTMVVSAAAAAAAAGNSSSSMIQLSSRQLELLEAKKLQQQRTHQHQQQQQQQLPFQTRSNKQQQEEPWEQPFAPSRNTTTAPRIGGGDRTKAAARLAPPPQKQSQTQTRRGGVAQLAGGTVGSEPPSQQKQQQQVPPTSSSTSSSSSSQLLESQRALVRSMMMMKSQHSATAAAAKHSSAAAAAVSTTSSTSTSNSGSGGSSPRHAKALLKRVLQKAASTKKSSHNNKNLLLQDQLRHRIFKRAVAAAATTIPAAAGGVAKTPSPTAMMSVASSAPEPAAALVVGSERTLAKRNPHNNTALLPNTNSTMTIPNEQDRAAAANVSSPRHRQQHDTASSSTAVAALQQTLSKTTTARCIIDDSGGGGNGGFDAFLDSLKREVSGQHLQLYASFLCAVQPTTGSSSWKNRNDVLQSLLSSSQQESPKVKVDTSTLQRLHAHLKTGEAVECRPVSQLVNDKQYAKQVMKRKQEQKDGGSTTVVVQANTKAGAAFGGESSEQPVFSSEKAASSSQTRQQLLSHHGRGEQQRVPPERVFQKTAISSAKNNNDDHVLHSRSLDEETTASSLQLSVDPILHARSSSPQYSSSSSSEAATSTTTTNSSCYAAASTSTKRSQLSVQIPSGASSDFDDTQLSSSSVPGRTAPLLPPQQAAKKQYLSSSKSNASSPYAVPWIAGGGGSVQLRSVADADNVAIMSLSPKTTVPWATVALRPVSRKNEDTAFVVPSIVDRGETNEEKLLLCGMNQEDVIVDSQHGGKNDEATVVIRLKELREPMETFTKESRVVICRKMIQQIQNEPGKSSKAVVTWKLPREDVEHDGMTLNMPTLKVTLILKKGKGPRKMLCFENAEDCLRFATAFYNMLPDTATAVESRSDDTPPLAEISDTASDVNSSVRMESLNDEEQIVLDRYRELRQTKPAQDALHQMMSLHDDPKEVDDDKLTEEEKQVANKYRKMLGLSLPHGAIQHKVMHDSVSCKISEAGINSPPEIVSAGELPSSPISTFTTTTVGEKSASDKLTDAEEKVADSYRIMLKRGIPADAVRHKMTRDQVDMKIAASVFASDDFTHQEEVKPAVQAQAQPSGTQLSAEDEATAEKYRKMLKLMIPAEGVRHKMVQDQVDPKIVAAVLGEEPALKKKEPPVVSKTRTSAVLSDEEESIASQYRKLLKFHVSKEIVLSRMQKEGVNEKIVTAVLGNIALASKPSEESKCSGSASTGSNLINLHWNAMEDVPEGSVWETSKSASDPERSDITKLVELFQRKQPSTVRKEKKAEESSGIGKAKLLDLTRSNNIAISLKAFKEFSHQELAEIIGFLDPTRKIRGERAQFIRDLLPTMTEIKIIDEFSGSDDRLVPAELWFRHLRGIKRLERKAQVMRTMEMFTAEAAEVRGNFRLLTQVCRQVMASSKLQDLLGMVLRIGNVMNEGTRTGGAAGFRFDSLLRLTQTKTSDGKITVLDYLVTVFVAKGECDTLDLSSDFPDCYKASRLLISDMTNEVKVLQESLKQCKSELKDLELDDAPRIPKVSDVSAPEGADPRSQLFASILSRYGSNEAADALEGPPRPTTEAFAQRDQFLAAVNDSKKDDKLSSSGLSIVTNSPDVDDDPKNVTVSSPKIENTLAGGMKRLRSFIETVEVSFSRLEKQRDDALEACKDLSRYCGESGGVGATSSLLDILSQFAKNVEDGLKKHDEQQQIEARKQKAQEARGIRSASSCESPRPADKKEGLSLVLLVNDVLKNANAQFREDFKKGRTLPNPSDPLKAIYERERIGMGTDNRRLDIVSAIREREGSIDSDEIHMARSRFAGVKHTPEKSDKQELNRIASSSPATLIEWLPESAAASDSVELPKRSTPEEELYEQKLSVKERALLLSTGVQQHLSKALVPVPIASTTKPSPQARRWPEVRTPRKSLDGASSASKLSTASNPALVNSSALIHRSSVSSTLETAFEPLLSAEQCATDAQDDDGAKELNTLVATNSEKATFEEIGVHFGATIGADETSSVLIPTVALSKPAASGPFFTPETTARVMTSRTADNSCDVGSEEEDRLRSRRSLSPPKSAGSLAEVMKALEQINKDAKMSGLRKVGETPPLPSKSPTKEKKSLAERAREKRQERNSESASSFQKQQEFPLALAFPSTSAATNSARRATIDNTPDTMKSNTNESSTARLARKKRLEKRMSR